MININSVVSELVNLMETEKQLKKRIDELKTIVFEHAGNSDSFETDEYTVIIKQTESIRLDTKQLYKDFPDIKNVYGKTTVSKSVIPAKRKNDKTA